MLIHIKCPCADIYQRLLFIEEHRNKGIRMRLKETPVKSWDLAIIFLALALTGFSAWSAYLKPGNSTQVLIEGYGNRWVFPLDAEETIPVPGPLGNTIIRIHDNQAWVESSPCDNQICVAAGRLHMHGEFAACLPNMVLVMIEGRNDGK